MKTTIALIMAAVALIAASCTTPERSSTEISVLVDRTETHQATPEASEIMPLYGLSADKWNAAQFTYSYVTDVSYNHHTTLTLAPGGNRLNASEYSRDRQVKRFETEVAAFLDSLIADTVGYPNSSVYAPLAEELNRMAQSTSSRRILLVYSDLMENAKDISFYNKKTLAELRSSPEKVQARLITKIPLKELDGIEVYFVFRPKDAANDDLFRLVSGFYKTMLEERGARVTVAANIPATTTNQ